MEELATEIRLYSPPHWRKHISIQSKYDDGFQRDTEEERLANDYRQVAAYGGEDYNLELINMISDHCIHLSSTRRPLR
jgi:hypothetical protein